MPRDRPQPPPVDPAWLDRSLDRYLVVGLIFMALLIAGFIAYGVREPSLRADATSQQETTYRDLGVKLFSANCTACHGKAAVGGSAPTLDAKQFLGSTSDAQMESVIGSGVPGTDMSAWLDDNGGTLTQEQVRQVVTWLRSLEAKAPSVPDWRSGKK